MSLGRLIVFEGADGVGKTELAQRTASLLSLIDGPFEYIPFPGRAEGSLGRFIYTLHHGAKELGVSHVTATALQALHVAAHLDGLETLILPSLEAGANIVLDRFWWSMVIYGRVDGIPEDTLSSLLQLERCGWRDTLPDVVFLISRRQPLKPEPLDVWSQTKVAYEILAEEERGRYPIVRVENELEVEGVLREITSLLKSMGLAGGEGLMGGSGSKRSNE